MSSVPGQRRFTGIPAWPGQGQAQDDSDDDFGYDEDDEDDEDEKDDKDDEENDKDSGSTGTCPPQAPTMGTPAPLSVVLKGTPECQAGCGAGVMRTHR